MGNHISYTEPSHLSIEEQTSLRKMRKLIIESQRTAIAIGLIKMAEKLYGVELEIEQALDRSKKIYSGENANDTRN